MHIFYRIFICLCIYLARAARAGPCYPEQWEGSIEIVGAQMDASSQYFTQGRVDFAFDITNQRQATNESVDMNGEIITLQTYMDYSNNVAYEIKDGVCTKLEITQPISLDCVPDTAVPLDTFYVGVSGRSLPLTGYRYNASAGTQMFVYLTPPPAPGAPWVPVTEIRRMGISGATAMSTSSYTNTTLGIRNTGVFNPPPICDHAHQHPPQKTWQPLVTKTFRVKCKE